MEFETTLDARDVRLIHVCQAASVGNVSRSYGSLECFVVGFDAAVPHPKRFLYQGCSVIVSNGRYCSKSIPLDGKCPDHLYIADPSSKVMFRFDVLLADGSLGKRCRPLRAVNFAAAEDLLGMSPNEFDGKTAAWQDRYVSQTMIKFPNCIVSIQVRNGSVIVTDLIVDPDIQETLPTFSKRALSQSRPSPSPSFEPVAFDSMVPHIRNAGRNTPPAQNSSTRSPSVYKTPRSEFAQKSASSRGDSCAPSSRSIVTVEELLELRSKFDDLLNRSNVEIDPAEVIVVSNDE